MGRKFGGRKFRGRKFGGRRLGRLAPALLLVLAVVPARAAAFPCSARAEEVASFQYGDEPSNGLLVSCRPGVSCELAVCVFAVKVSIHGVGVVGGVIEGPFGVVKCGPIAGNCSVASADFEVPFGGAFVECSSGDTVAVHVELVCSPIQLR